MTTLHNKMNEAVADVTTDYAALATAAQRRGLAIRRRRAALTSIGSVAAVAVLGVGIYAVTPHHTPTESVAPAGSTSPSTSASVTPSETPTTNSDDTVPLTGQGLAAALGAAAANAAFPTSEASSLTVSSYAGQSDEREAYAQVYLAMGGTGRAGVVGINIQHLSDFSEKDLPRDCSQDFLNN